MAGYGCTLLPVLALKTASAKDRVLITRLLQLPDTYRRVALVYRRSYPVFRHLRYLQGLCSIVYLSAYILWTSLNKQTYYKRQAAICMLAYKDGYRLFSRSAGKRDFKHNTAFFRFKRAMHFTRRPTCIVAGF